ncbi:MAG TPA: hypothetical protein VM537_07225 [Anaerolineae bacterium]|nr:hypothetical protein [Anaerolineae bacterium]
MSDVERMLIGSVQLGKTKGGKPVANLYSTDRRLEFPVLVLFDLSMLEMIGIDPNELGTEPVYKRFWGYYTESDKTTSNGRAYRDCQYLELVDSPATTTSTDTTALLAELRHQTLLLEIIATRLGSDLSNLRLGDTDENADWISDPETRAEEQAIHDELAAMNEARQNGKTDDGVPMDSEKLVDWLNARDDNPKSCDGIGHLAYCVKKQLGDEWGWPNGTDQEGWRNTAAAWYKYWQALQ